MKPTLAALSLFIFTPLLVPYGSFVPRNSGNPNWASYVGQEGSTYDIKANPPQTNGVVSYNPLAALPNVTPNAPSGSALSRP